MGVWTKSVFRYQSVTTGSDSREYEGKKERQKKTKEKAEAFKMAIKNVLKQPEKNAQRDPGEKGWACYYCGKEGHLKRDCLHASVPPLAPCPVYKGPH